MKATSIDRFPHLINTNIVGCSCLEYKLGLNPYTLKASGVSVDAELRAINATNLPLCMTSHLEYERNLTISV